MNKGETTRQRIIEQAAPIFNQRGFAGCSIQDILAATGLEKGGLYRHFASKEELATEAFRYAAGLALERRTQRLAQIDGAPDKLRSVVLCFVHKPSRTPGGCVLMNTAIDADDTNPALRKLAHDGIQQWKRSLIDIVTDGIARGEIRPNTEPRRIANTIISTLEGALVISRLERNRTALEDAEVTLNALIDSVLPDTPC